jgi:hypothetical protein
MSNKQHDMSNSFWSTSSSAPVVPAAVSLGLFPQDARETIVPTIVMTAGPDGTKQQQVEVQRVQTPILVGRIPTTSGACASCADSLRPGGLKGLCGFVDANGRYGEHTFVKCQPPNQVFGCYYDDYQQCGSVLQGAQTAAYSSAPFNTALKSTFDQSDYASAAQTFFASLNRI